MKESRMIIIISIILFIIIGPIAYILYIFCPNSSDYMSIATNLYCGIIVALITSICEYCISKRKIINNIYSSYFDIYRTYYYSKNTPFLLHYNSINIYKKIDKANSKIIGLLDEYHGFFKKHDKTYKKMNPQINLGKNYKARKMIKSIVKWNNKKIFFEVFEPIMMDVESVLININSSRFKKDKAQMINLFNYIYDKNISE